MGGATAPLEALAGREELSTPSVLLAPRLSLCFALARWLLHVWWRWSKPYAAVAFLVVSVSGGRGGAGQRGSEARHWLARMSGPAPECKNKAPGAEQVRAASDCRETRARAVLVCCVAPGRRSQRPGGDQLARAPGS
jgi:hypothetical protein